MKNRKTVLFIVLIISVFLLSSCSTSKNVSVGNDSTRQQSILSKAFIAGNHNISIMEVALPNDIPVRINEISQRLQSSMKQNQQWFNDYISKHANTGGNLPWDEKFGISKDEYNELIASSDKMVLTEKMKSAISIEKENDGKLRLVSNQDLLYLNGLKIDIKNNCLITDSGVFKYSNAINASDDQKLTGRWNGGSWSLNFEELKDINNIDPSKTYGTINIVVGQLESTNQMLIYYKETVIRQGQSHNGVEIILLND